MDKTPGLDRWTVLAIGLTTIVALAVNVSLIPRLMRMSSARGWDVAILIAGVVCAATISRRQLIPLMRNGNRSRTLPWIYAMTASLMIASLGLASTVIRLLS